MNAEVSFNCCHTDHYTLNECKISQCVTEMWEYFNNYRGSLRQRVEIFFFVIVESYVQASILVASWLVFSELLLHYSLALLKCQ